MLFLVAAAKSDWGTPMGLGHKGCAVLCLVVLCRSYGDNPEKYIRIGRDALTLGNFVDNPPANNTGEGPCSELQQTAP
jgi:hypothetical protein